MRIEGAGGEYLHYHDETTDSLASAFQRADVVCFYVMTPTADLCVRTAAAAKLANPRIKVAFGGPHLASQWQAILKTGVVDLVAPKPEDPRVLSRALLHSSMSGGTAILGGSGPPSMVGSHGLRMSGQGGEEYIDYSLLPKSLPEYYYNISSSNGCAYSCSFCSDGTRALRVRSIDNLMEELAFLDRNLPHGTWVHFFDTIFTFPRERASGICDLWLTVPAISISAAYKGGPHHSGTGDEAPQSALSVLQWGSTRPITHHCEWRARQHI